MGQTSKTQPEQVSALKQLTALLLQQPDHFPSIQRAVDRLYRLFVDISEFDPKAPQNRESIRLPSGKALGSAWAAHCIKDALRTKKFLSGVHQAIQDRLTKYPGEVVQVLYAGTGPFGTLATPLIPFFQPEEVQFTFLEINPKSIQTFQKVLTVLGFGKYVSALEQCDACTYAVDPHHAPHIIIVEAMQPALQQEPQVAITLNLAPQLAKGGVFVPECIRIHAGALNPRKDTERMLGAQVVPGDHFILLDSIMKWNTLDIPANSGAKEPFPTVTVAIPPDLPAGFKHLCLFTEITVFGTERLGYWDCHLTQPFKVMNLDQGNNPTQKVSFQYVLGEMPGFISKLGL